MAKRKNKDDFEMVLENHKKIIYKIARSYTKDQQSRYDLTQEIIIQLWTSFDSYNPNFKYSTWIYRIALNVSISSLRKKKRSLETSIDNDSQVFNVNVDNDDENSTNLETQIEQLHKFIALLKPIDKAIILLYLESKSNIEIADIIGITPSNVSTKINRIKIKLKENFSTYKL